MRRQGGLPLGMNIAKLRICYVAGTLGQGGAERQLFYALRALRQGGAFPRLLCLAENGFWAERIHDLGVPVTYVGGSKSRVRRLFRIMGELRRDRPHVLQSQHFYTSGYVGLAARLQGLCDIGALRSNGLMEVRDCGRPLGWLSLHAPRRIAANSRAAIDYAVQQGIRPERLHFLPNVVDTEMLQPRDHSNGAAVTLIAVGNLARRKRFDRFLRILAKLRKEVSRPVRGVIVGAGPLRSILAEQAETLGLLPCGVEFKGAVGDIGPAYQAADICVSTSDYEGTPNVLLEAMACGLPVVGTEVGGVAEIIRQGRNGFSVPPSDEQGLVDAIRRLVEDGRLRKEMGQEARAYVLENHSATRLPTTLGNLYDWALAPENRRSAGLSEQSHL